jgi:hypothetical protein
MPIKDKTGDICHLLYTIATNIAYIDNNNNMLKKYNTLVNIYMAFLLNN